MTIFKYPAPFDPPVGRLPLEVPNAPSPPHYCGPPLPIALFEQKPKTRQTPSIFSELFGDDLDRIAQMFDSAQGSSEQLALGEQLLTEQKTLSGLTEAEHDLLSSWVLDFIDGGDRHRGKWSGNAPVRAEHREGLCVLEDGEEQGQGTQAVHARSEPHMQSALSPFAGAYSWLSGAEGDE